MADKNESPDCPVCGARVEHLLTPEPFSCSFCGTTGQGTGRCPEGHFICAACSEKDARAIIDSVVFASTGEDPAAMAELVMSHPSFPQRGCEHAFLAAGVFLAALRNSPYGKGRIGDRDLVEAFERAGRQITEDSCALTGVCGILPAIGACFSIFLGAHRGADREQRITMEAITRVSGAVARLAGPSCCKAAVRAALSEATAVLGERFGIALAPGEREIICRHSEKNLQGCRETLCPYYRKPAKDLFAEMKFVPGTVCSS
jgi:hypothetical protein